MAAKKVSYIELRSIREALEFLGKINLSIAYEIGKNLRRVKQALKEPDELLAETRKKYSDTDAAGELVQYATNKDGEVAVFTEETRKEFGIDAQVFTKISDKDKLKAFEEEIKKLENDAFEVDFHTIPLSKLKDYLDKTGLHGKVLEPLIDTIITEA